MLFMSLKRRCGDWGSRGTRDEQAASDGSPVRLKRRVVGARDVKQTAGVFRSLFGFQEVAMNDGPRTMLAVGRGAILIVPSEEVGGTEGMVALSLVRSEEHTSELQSQSNLVCRLLLEQKKNHTTDHVRVDQLSP